MERDCFLLLMQTIETIARVFNQPLFYSINQLYTQATTSCLDTIEYTLSKATSLNALSINNATSATALAQYFDAPQSISVEGFDFYAYKTDDYIWIFAHSDKDDKYYQPGDRCVSGHSTSGRQYGGKKEKRGSTDEIVRSIVNQRK